MAVLTSMARELAFSPSADELILTLVGVVDDLPDALGQDNVTSVPTISTGAKVPRG